MQCTLVTTYSPKRLPLLLIFGFQCVINWHKKYKCKKDLIIYVLYRLGRIFTGFSAPTQQLSPELKSIPGWGPCHMLNARLRSVNWSKLVKNIHLILIVLLNIMQQKIIQHKHIRDINLGVKMPKRRIRRHFVLVSPAMSLQILDSLKCLGSGEHKRHWMCVLQCILLKALKDNL